MSNKSGIAEQIISIPRGGGEINGLGESFSANLHSGTGNFNVPIQIPKGRNGFQPDLNLSYSTGNGNTSFGLGWHLSIPEISRKTSKGVPLYQGKDTFLLSGLEDLVPVEEAPNFIRYQARTEGIFSLITHFLDEENNYWEIKTKDGIVSFYGRPRSKGNDPSTVFDPDKPSKIFSWRISESHDPFGNKILYEYERDLQRTNQRDWNQLYLKRIKYVDYTDSLGAEQFLVSIEVDYQTDRVDASSVYTAGFEIRTRKLCKRISVWTHPAPDHSLLFRSYSLVHHHQEKNRIALLQKIELKGHDGDQEEAIPALCFDYTSLDLENSDFFPLEGSELPTESLASGNLELIDLFGNGLPDFVQLDGQIRYWKNQGQGFYDRPRIMQEAPAGIALENPNAQFMDANGEGRVDLLLQLPALSGYFSTNFDGEWDKQSFHRYKQAPTFSFQDAELRFVDLNGDGITDAIRTGNRLEYYFNDGDAGWTELKVTDRKPTEDFPNIRFSDPRVRLADMTGDNMQDIVLLQNGIVTYWPSLGHGRWGKRIQMSKAPRFPDGFNPQRVLMGDISGDGPNDIIFVDHCKVSIWINQNGNGFSEEITIFGTPPLANADAVRLADVLGTGVAGLLWSSDQRIDGRPNYFFLELNAGNKPFLLREMDNSMGAVTKIKYKPSTHFYKKDSERVETRWKTNLPFPVNVVAEVQVHDLIAQNKLITQYSYRHGYWDGAEREFRGFGRVEQLDTLSFAEYTSQENDDPTDIKLAADHFAPPTKTINWFSQGPVGPGDGDWQTLDYSEEYWSEDPSLLNGFSEMSTFLQSLGSRREQRDALRTLRGTLIRTELYSLDGNPNDPSSISRQQRPYKVAESLFGIRKEGASLTPMKGMSGSIFFPFEVASRTTTWERGDDPMTEFTFNDNYTALGQAQRIITAACPRTWRNIEDVMPATTPFLATLTEVQFAEGPENGPYIKDRVCKTSAFEILQEVPIQLQQLLDIAREGNQLRLYEQNLTYFDGPAFIGLPFGQLGAFGAPVRSESLILTDELLTAICQSDDPQGNPVEIPDFLLPGVTPQQDHEEYPAAFLEGLPELAGFTFYDGSGEQTKGYWAQSSRTRFDFHNPAVPSGGMPVQQQDALGRIATISYDSYHMLPIKATNPIGIGNVAVNDYRTLQATVVIDANENVTQVKFSPFGFVKETYQLGKEGKMEGDGWDRNDPKAVPSTVQEYRLQAFCEDGQPAFIKTSKREHHLLDPGISEAEKSKTIVSVQFFDGFGRIIQKRVQAEDQLFSQQILPELQGDPDTTRSFQATSREEGEPSNVVVSGWKIFDNKGQVIRMYEPFYDSGYDYAPPQLEQFEAFTEQFYDPLGRAIRTVNPDGSEQWVLYGIPDRLDDPTSYQPTPWEAYTYDENDNAQRIGLPDLTNDKHWNTPASVEIDPLGRAIKTIAREGPNQEDEIVSLATYDIRGNQLSMIDPLGRIAFRNSYDLTYDENNGSRLWRIESHDGGVRKMIHNVMGQELERRDGKGSLCLKAYDELNRPICFWSRNKADLPVTLRQKLLYGDSANLSDPAAFNLNLRLFQHFDEAGKVEKTHYDFKGNTLSSTRQVIKDEVVTALCGTPEFQHFQVDWAVLDPDSILEEDICQIDSRFDALNRVQQQQLPRDVEGQQKVILSDYDRSGKLKAIRLLSTSGASASDLSQASILAEVKHIVYNARGQRVLQVSGNKLITRFAYDKKRFWVSRMRTEKYVQDDPTILAFQPTGSILQDLAYEYDLIGNVTTIQDRSPDAGIEGTSAGKDNLRRSFVYDPLYRLISATGREHESRQLISRDQPWLHAMNPTDVSINSARLYTRLYSYDKAGNMLEMRHQVSENTAGFTRTFTMHQEHNHIVEYQQGGPNFQLQHDENGNTIQEGLSRHFHWNQSDELHSFRIQHGEVTLEARYLYNANGNRIKKIVWRPGGEIRSTTYIGGVFEHHRSTEGSNNRIHLIDGQKQIASVRVGLAFSDSTPSPAILYRLCDHLWNVQMLTDIRGDLFNREDLYPYGGTSFGSFADKRFRFTGKERDRESGLNYHGARYYAPWLKRWLSPDPAGKVDGPNLFIYAQNNPIRYLDPTGRESTISKVGDFFWDIGKWVYNFNKNRILNAVRPWRGEGYTWGAVKVVWEKAKEVGQWLNRNRKWAWGIAGGAVVGIVTLLAVRGIKKGLNDIMNWGIALPVRIATNAAFGYLLGGELGSTMGVIGGITGAVFGAVHGSMMAYAQSYDWSNPLHWLAFLSDNTWSLANSFAGSAFVTLFSPFLGINKDESKGSGALFMTEGVFENYDTTFGNVIAGNLVPKHEQQHVLQARLFGPLYFLFTLQSFVINVIPWWLAFDTYESDCGGIDSFAEYFLEGVYPYTWHEWWAYDVQGTPCP